MEMGEKIDFAIFQTTAKSGTVYHMGDFELTEALSPGKYKVVAFGPNTSKDGNHIYFKCILEPHRGPKPEVHEGESAPEDMPF
jgi:hypothetical protein